MTDPGELSIKPGAPAAFGVAQPELPIEKVEPSRMLANEVRDRLRTVGLTDPQIDDWADAYFAHEDEGGATDLLVWIAQRQSGD